MHVEDIRPEGWACTYLVANNGEAVLIDPVYDYINHYETVLAERGLDLVACMATHTHACLLYTSPSPRDYAASRMPSSA